MTACFAVAGVQTYLLYIKNFALPTYQRRQGRWAYRLSKKSIFEASYPYQDVGLWVIRKMVNSGVPVCFAVVGVQIFLLIIRSFPCPNIEAPQKVLTKDVVYFRILVDFNEYRSKPHKPKWKPVQEGHRTSPDFKSIWFLMIEKFLEFDEKILSSQPKTASQGAL